MSFIAQSAMGEARSYDLSTKRFHLSGAFLIVAPSGGGKTTMMLDAIRDPKRYMNLEGEFRNRYLFVFTGASNKLRKDIEEMSGRSRAFSSVHLPYESLAECGELLDKLGASKGADSYVIVIDDFVSFGQKEVKILKQLLFLYRRHENICVITMVHQLRNDPSGATYLLADHADRVYLPTSSMNLENLFSLVKRRHATNAVAEKVASEFGDRNKFRMAAYDSGSRLLILDFGLLEAGAGPVPTYGKHAPRTRETRAGRITSRCFQISAADR